MFIAGAGVIEKSFPRTMGAVLWAPNVLGILLSLWILWRSEHRMDLLPSRMRALTGSR
jgi:hypothetical protein